MHRLFLLILAYKQILQASFSPFYAYLFLLGNFKYFLFEFTDSFICLVESDIEALLNYLVQSLYSAPKFLFGSFLYSLLNFSVCSCIDFLILLNGL